MSQSDQGDARNLTHNQDGSGVDDDELENVHNRETSLDGSLDDEFGSEAVELIDDSGQETDVDQGRPQGGRDVPVSLTAVKSGQTAPTTLSGESSPRGVNRSRMNRSRDVNRPRQERDQSVGGGGRLELKQRARQEEEERDLARNQQTLESLKANLAVSIRQEWKTPPRGTQTSEAEKITGRTPGSRGDRANQEPRGLAASRALIPERKTAFQKSDDPPTQKPGSERGQDRLDRPRRHIATSTPMPLYVPEAVRVAPTQLTIATDRERNITDRDRVGGATTDRETEQEPRSRGDRNPVFQPQRVEKKGQEWEVPASVLKSLRTRDFYENHKDDETAGVASRYGRATSGYGTTHPQGRETSRSPEGCQSCQQLAAEKDELQRRLIAAGVNEERLRTQGQTQSQEIAHRREDGEVLHQQLTQMGREKDDVVERLRQSEEEIRQVRRVTCDNRQTYEAESARMNAQLRETQDVQEEAQREWRSVTTQNEARAQQESRLQEVQINSLLQQLDRCQIQLANSVAEHDARDARWTEIISDNWRAWCEHCQKRDRLTMLKSQDFRAS